RSHGNDPGALCEAAQEVPSMPSDRRARFFLCLCLFAALWHIAGRVVAGVPYLPGWLRRLAPSLFEVADASRLNEGRLPRRLWLVAADATLAAIVARGKLPIERELHDVPRYVMSPECWARVAVYAGRGATVLLLLGVAISAIRCVVDERPCRPSGKRD